MTPLPDKVRDDLYRVVQEADCLLFGELHGTQELPLLIGELLSGLTTLGCGGLAMEIPQREREPIVAWASGATEAVPRFFAEPGGDGRGNEQVLALLGHAVRAGWQILCFDLDADSRDWRERDSTMADNLAAQWRLLCPDRKVIGVCGNLHSRLTPAVHADLWPSFAACLQQRNPQIVVQSVHVECHSGSLFNETIRELFHDPIPEAEWREDSRMGHSFTLHLPKATPATFLAPPSG